MKYCTLTDSDLECVFCIVSIHSDFVFFIGLFEVTLKQRNKSSMTTNSAK